MKKLIITAILCSSFQLVYAMMPAISAALPKKEGPSGCPWPKEPRGANGPCEHPGRNHGK